MRELTKSSLLPLVGAAILAAFSVAAVPFSRGLFGAPRTPYDAGEAEFLAPSWIVLMHGDALIPRGASVVVRTGIRNLAIDTYLHRLAVALLPGRRIVPAALWGSPTDPMRLAEARYEIVIGSAPARPAGTPVLELPEGSIWMR